MSAEVRQIVEIVEKIDKPKSSKLRAKKKVNHLNTKTTKQTEKITELMQNDLRDIAEQITKMVERNRKIPIEKIRQKFKKQVGSVIANGIRESYFLGLHFIESFAERTVQLTDTHLNEINSQIEDQINRFWIQVEKIINTSNEKRDSKIVGAAAPRDLALFNNFNSFFERSAISMNFFALSQATVETRKQVFREEIDEFGITVEGSIQIPQMIWVTRKDNRVDTICLNLEGRTWDVDDSSMPRPVTDTHIGCRCRLMPLDNGKVFNS